MAAYPRLPPSAVSLLSQPWKSRLKDGYQTSKGTSAPCNRAGKLGAKAAVFSRLIKANKNFDPVVLPGMNHTSGGDYGERRRRDFFVKHLLGIDPPAWAPSPTASGAAGVVKGE